MNKVEIMPVEGSSLRACSNASDQLLNLHRLRACGEAVQEEFKGEHQRKNEKAEEAGLDQTAFGNPIEYACDHDEGPDGGEWPQHKNAGGAANVRRRQQAQSEIEQYQSGIRNKNAEHTACGKFKISPQYVSMRREGSSHDEGDEGKRADDLAPHNSSKEGASVIAAFPNERAATHGSAEAA